MISSKKPCSPKPRNYKLLSSGDGASRQSSLVRSVVLEDTRLDVTYTNGEVHNFSLPDTTASASNPSAITYLELRDKVLVIRTGGGDKTIDLSPLFVDERQYVQFITANGSRLKVTNIDGSTYELNLAQSSGSSVSARPINVLNASGTRVVATLAVLD